MRLVRLLALLPCVLMLLLHSPVVLATPYWGESEVADWLARSQPDLLAPPTHLPGSGAPAARGEVDVDDLEMFGRIVQFLSQMQVSDPVHPHFGGMREGEHMLEVIQTDNTSEAIWLWSRYYELTGDAQYQQNILDAWTYSMNFPAYLEEGGPSPLYGYYRMYNCGWATRAELKYRQAFGDDTYQAYGDSCAGYIRSHNLLLFGDPFYGAVNPPVYSWALGNLYHVGSEGNHPLWCEDAVSEAERTVKGWIEGSPEILRREIWAMTGGATMWGLVSSFFRAHPDSAAIWLPLYKDEMDTFSTPGQFTNAWNGWYALGHFATGEALNDPYHLGVHQTLKDTLVAEDGDEDGGIPARPEDPDTMDQSWVSSYLGFMGLSPVLGPSAGVETAIAAAPLDRLRLSGGPNPARSGLKLSFDLERAADVSFAIYDCAGRRVAGLHDGRMGEGAHAVTWRGRDQQGRRVAAGTYWAVLRTADERASWKILWLR